MLEAKESLFVRLLRRLAGAVFSRPGWFVWPQFALFGVAVWFTLVRLDFDLDRNNLVGSDKLYHRNFLALKKEFPGQDDLVAVVESEADADALDALTGALAGIEKASFMKSNGRNDSA